MQVEHLKSVTVAILFGVAVVVVSAVANAADPAIKCETGKLKVAGKYGNCRLKAEAKGIKKGLTPDFNKCQAKFVAKFNQAESKAGSGVCPSEADETSINARITGDTAEIATLLGGGTTASACGNGVVETGEDCDFGDLSGATCTTQGLFGDGLTCTPGTCVFDTSTCSPTRLKDNGTTVTDVETGLMWEKQVEGVSSCSSVPLRCVDSLFTWDNAMGDWISELNGFADDFAAQPGFAGYSDWRLPTAPELQTILDCSFGEPCIDPVFGPTNAFVYWSSTTSLQDGPDAAWFVSFSSSSTSNVGSKASPLLAVRAVRGGM